MLEIWKMRIFDKVINFVGCWNHITIFCILCSSAGAFTSVDGSGRGGGSVSTGCWDQASIEHQSNCLTIQQLRMVSSVLHEDPASSMEEDWRQILPYQDSSHNSATIIVPSVVDNSSSTAEEGTTESEKDIFASRLEDTVEALRELGKSSVWVEIPMRKAGLIERMEDLGFDFHHAKGKTAKLNRWLKDDVDSKVPEFATHHVGVGALVINSRNEILCVKGLRRNYMPWKIPGGLADIGEHIPEAGEREVLEETGIQTKFHSILTFRHAHGLANGRSDLFFVCRLDPIEEKGVDGNIIIPDPIPQECEIADAKWIPLAEYRAMIEGLDGHPMMKEVMKIFDEGRFISHRNVQSVVPGRRPSPIYQPNSSTD